MNWANHGLHIKERYRANDFVVVRNIVAYKNMFGKTNKFYCLMIDVIKYYVDLQANMVVVP
jgi:hypothetical protein